MLTLSEPDDFILRDFHGDVGEYMDQSLYPRPRRFRRGEKLGLATKIRWDGTMALPHCHGGPQIASVSLGTGLSLYLLSVNRMVPGTMMALTLLGFSFYAFLTLAATFVYSCPYQTPPSLVMQTLAGYISQRCRPVMVSLSSALSTLDSARIYLKTCHLLL